MTFYLRSICQRLYVYSIFIACQLCFVRSHNHTRLFSFTNTDIKSPADIEDSCLTIGSTLGIRYLGLTLDLLKASSDGSCKIWDFELNGIRKNIVRDKYDRRLCRTKFTVSINNTECVQTVQHICQENDINSIYFQECVQLDLYEMDETATKDFEDSNSITMSNLPVPIASNLRPVYEIPKTHCNIKRINSDDSYDQTANWSEVDTVVFYISCAFILRQSFNVRSEKTQSLFSFSFTNASSPNHIEDICLMIDNSTLFSMYFGVQLFIRQSTKSMSCKPENIELKEIRNDIIHAEKARPLCRTTITVSMSSIHCEKSIVDLKRVCHEQTPIKTSIYFQECEDVIHLDKISNGTMTISMSAFSTPTNSRFGPMYEIPRVKCNRRNRKSAKGAENHS